MDNKSLNLTLPADDGVFVLRLDDSVLYFKPVNIRVMGFPHPIGSRIVSYEMELSKDGIGFTAYKRNYDTTCRFCFTVSRYTTDIAAVLSYIRAHFLEIVSKGKRVSDTDLLIHDFTQKNTFSIDDAKHFIHIETYKVENNRTTIDECVVTYLSDGESITTPAASYTSDFPWNVYVTKT